MRLPVDIVQSLRPSYEGRSVCVTGGAGFIGGHLVDALLTLGATVSVIDDLSGSTLEHLGEQIELDASRCRFTHGSILDDEAMTEAARGASILFHQAALVSVPRSIEDPRRTMAVNAHGTVVALECARAAGVSRFVYASSSSVYGSGAGGGGPEGGDAPCRETMPVAPLSPYGVGKLTGETAVRAWSHSYGLSGVSLRYFNVFGPRQDANSPYAAVIGAFSKRLLAGLPPVIYGDGRQTRDFTFVANVVAANLLAGASTRRFMGEAVNIGGGTTTDLITVATLIAERTGGGGGGGGVGTPVVPTFAPARVGEVRHSTADLSLAARLLKYHPVATLNEGLDETVAWYRQAYAGT